MCNIFEGIHSAGFLCFRRGRSSWKSLKNLNTARGGSLSILRIGLAPPWRAAIPELVVRAMSVNTKRISHAR